MRSRFRTLFKLMIAADFLIFVLGLILKMIKPTPQGMIGNEFIQELKKAYFIDQFIIVLIGLLIFMIGITYLVYTMRYEPLTKGRKGFLAVTSTAFVVFFLIIAFSSMPVLTGKATVSSTSLKNKEHYSRLTFSRSTLGFREHHYWLHYYNGTSEEVSESEFNKAKEGDEYYSIVIADKQLEVCSKKEHELARNMDIKVES